MPFTSSQYWEEFCDWVAAQGPAQSQRIMSAYIEENFADFMQFVENYKVFHPTE